MMGLFGGLQNASNSLRGKGKAEDAPPEGSAEEETSVLCAIARAAIQAL